MQRSTTVSFSKLREKLLQIKMKKEKILEQETFMPKLYL